MRRKSITSVLVWSACVLIPFGAVESEAPRQRASALELPREVPGDPPGKPAEPVPGALAAPVIRYGIAKTFQVNVDFLGANIPGDAANEPSIAVSPVDPNVMAIGWRQFDTVSSNFRQAGWGYSGDGGRTWTFPGVIEPGVFRSDPVLCFDADGNFFYNSLKVVGDNFSCQVFESNDGGMSWGPPVEAYGGDKQWMTIDRTGGPGHGNFYQAWNTAAGCCYDTTFNRSVDGGATFTHPTLVAGRPIFGTLDVDADGTLYVCGIDPSNTAIFYVARSSDAWDPGSDPTWDNVAQVYMGGSLRLGDAGSPNPVGLLGQVCIAVDRTGGPTDGNVYVVCSVFYPFGVDPLDVHFVRSSDRGETWSSPVKINSDLPSAGSWQWFATLSVAPNGRIDVVWNDTRAYRLPNLSQLYYSYSSDGGVSWSVDQQLSPTFDSHLGWPNQAKLGDYYDMVSDDVGADLAWAATFNGEQDVYFTRIGGYDCNSNGVADSIDIALWHSADVNENGIPDECEAGVTGVEGGIVSAWELYPNVPNPFNPTTTIRYRVPESGGVVVVRIFDVSGRLVRTFERGFETAGERAVVWNGRDDRQRPVASGIYFYRLDAPGFTQTRKMLLLR